ncbi:MAG: hypothetical protein LBF61_06025 [Azoarcus sp.]|nr:hypothetical protein [Azoarcus sp.]
MTFPFPAITPPSAADVAQDATLVIQGGENINLFALAGSPSAPIPLLATLPYGVSVGSRNPALAALDVGQFPAGSQIRLEVHGNIEGAGGAGGRGYTGSTQFVRQPPTGEYLEVAGAVGGNPKNVVYGWYEEDDMGGTLVWDGVNLGKQNFSSVTINGWTYFFGYTFSDFWYGVWREGLISMNTYFDGGAGGGESVGGNGGRGQGYDGAVSAGGAGAQNAGAAAGNTLAGSGGASGHGGIGGLGGAWGMPGNTGATGGTGQTGNAGNYTNGMAGSPGGTGASGGAAGRCLVMGAAEVTLTNNGTVAGTTG